MKASTEASYRQRIARVVEAIAADPAAEHRLDSLAALAAFSPYHFHRVYRAVTGEALADTIRRIRLHHAASLLVGSNRPVVEIAGAVGYGSAQSFARAFREFTSLSPSELQRLSQDHGAGAGAVRLRELPPMPLLGLHHQGPLSMIPHTFRRLAALATRAGWHGRAPASLAGVCQGDPESEADFSYFAALIRPDHADTQGALAVDAAGLTEMTVAGGRYASFILRGPYTLINATWEILFSAWLPASGHEPDHRPALELYRSEPGTAPALCETELLLPVRLPASPPLG
ncbi:AraC family transcriptional regulator [Cupriavidus basilensis]|uniref:AraC family transcriptional regulator n=1 Tax=Cupriavidus basilensis TaxID=68895 RepID=A0A643FQS4_9BURK|nr:AraC family transcriptional regulator [Cupriavidus basilensis]QOT79571.1 AraC family transcriptional regulator [Cupriavidus basilensis]